MIDGIEKESALIESNEDNRYMHLTNPLYLKNGQKKKRQLKGDRSKNALNAIDFRKVKTEKTEKTKKKIPLLRNQLSKVLTKPRS